MTIIKMNQEYDKIARKDHRTIQVSIGLIMVWHRKINLILLQIEVLH